MKKIVGKLSLGSVIFFGSLLAISAFAAGNMPARGPIPFSVYDVNGDGIISQKEFYDVRAKRIQQRVDQGMPMRNVGNAPDFSYFDTNNDGKITETELLKGQNAMMQNRKQNMGNGYGKGYGQGMGKQ